MHDKLKVWKERINTNFDGQDFPQDIYFNATAVLKTGSLYKHGKNYFCKVYVEDGKYNGAENHQCNMLSDSDFDDGYFEA